MNTVKTLSLLLSTASLASAAGFQLQERSTGGLGRAFSGEAAIAEDASAIATNAASLLLLDGSQFSAGFSYIAPSSEVKGSLGAAATKDSGPLQEALVPYLYASHKINDHFAVGLALHSRFGLSTDYAESFLGTAFANKSEITTIYISPKAAIQLNEKWSVGAGLDITKVEGQLTSSFPSGLEIADIEGDDWAYGFNIGTTYQLTDKTRLGLAYHSAIDVNIEGSATSQVGAFAPAGSSDIKLDSELPASLEFSIFHDLNNQWSLHGSATWTGWSVFDQLVIQTDNPNFPPPVQEQWKDVYRVAVGATYRHNDQWTFRAGAAFDESPVRNAELRTLRIPDSDRIWLSAGTTYTINENYSVDFGYTHIVARSVEITETPGFSGKASGHVNILGLSFNGSF